MLDSTAPAALVSASSEGDQPLFVRQPVVGRNLVEPLKRRPEVRLRAALALRPPSEGSAINTELSRELADAGVRPSHQSGQREAASRRSRYVHRGAVCGHMAVRSSRKAAPAWSLQTGAKAVSNAVNAHGPSGSSQKCVGTKFNRRPSPWHQ